MRLPRHHSAAAVVLGLLAFFAPALMASQSGGWGVIVATNAFVSHGDSESASVAVGSTVREGDRLTTEAGGALVLSRGEDLITMAENSRIVIVDPQPNGTTLIDQPYGQVEYHVTKEAKPHFEVDSPLLATIVKGTTFSVSAQGGANSVSVSEGRVVAKNRASGASSSVGAGQMGSVDGAGKNVSVGAAPAKGASPAAGGGAPAASGSSNSDGNSGGAGNGNKGGGNGGGRGDSGRSDNGSGGNNGHGSGNANAGGNGNANGKGKPKNNGNGGGHGHGGN